MHFVIILCFAAHQCTNIKCSNICNEIFVLDPETILTEDYVHYVYMMNVTGLMKRYLSSDVSITYELGNGLLEKRYDILSNIYMEVTSSHASIKEQIFSSCIKNYHFNKENAKWKTNYTRFMDLCNQDKYMNNGKCILDARSAIDIFNVVIGSSMSKGMKLTIIKCMSNVKRENLKLTFTADETAFKSVTHNLSTYKLGIGPNFDHDQQSDSNIDETNVTNIYDLKDFLKLSFAKGDIVRVNSNIIMSFMSGLANKGFDARAFSQSYDHKSIEETICKEAQSFIKRVFLQGYNLSNRFDISDAPDLNAKCIIYTNDMCNYELTFYHYLLDTIIGNSKVALAAMELTRNILTLIKLISFYAIYDMLSAYDTGYRFYVQAITNYECSMFKQITQNIKYFMFINDFRAVIEHQMNQLVRVNLQNLSPLKKGKTNRKIEKLVMFRDHQINIF